MLDDSSPLTLATGVLPGDTAWDSSCRRAVPRQHKAHSPLLGQETPQIQPPNCQHQKGPSRDQLHPPRRGHPVTQVCLECLQTGTSLTLPGQPAPAAISANTALPQLSPPQKVTSRRFIPKRGLPRALPRARTGPPELNPHRWDRGRTPGAPGSGGEVTALSPAPVPPRCPLTSCS